MAPDNLRYRTPKRRYKHGQQKLGGWRPVRSRRAQEELPDLVGVDAVVRRTYPELLAAMREEEVKLGRHMTNSELDTFARRFYAEEYRQDLRRGISSGLEDDNGEGRGGA